MRDYRSTLLLPLLLAGCVSHPTDEIRLRSVNWKDLGDGVALIGKLGIPLGETAEIEATLVSGRSAAPGVKSLESSYLLRIEKVRGASLPAPILMLFAVVEDLAVPTAFDALQKLKPEAASGSRTPTEIERLERGYVDQRYRLLVFEEGSFEGYPPKNLPAEFSYRQGIAEPGLAPNEPTPRFRPVVKVLRVLETISSH